MFSVAIELGASNNISHYLPLSVSAELRGYTEDKSLVRAAAVAGKVVSITGLAARFCPTGRDLFLEKRVGVDTPSWERSVLGKVVDPVLVALHASGLQHMEDAFEASVRTSRPVSLPDLKQTILASGEDIARKNLLTDWKYEGSDPAFKNATIDSFADHVAGAAGVDLVEKTLAAILDLVSHETKVLLDYLAKRRRGLWGLGCLRRSSDWMAEARATLGRLQTGLKLDKNEAETRLFGISPNVAPDFLYAVTLVGDIKLGAYHSFYESVATGYAIFAEHCLGRRINTAAILAVDLDLTAGKLRDHRIVVVRPDDEQRQLWITRRDLALQVVRAEAAPPHPADIAPCTRCPYRSHCWENGTPGGTPTTPIRAPQRAGPAQRRSGRE